MRITRFKIQGFKNIADISVDGLSGINVFFGLNDVGKSNIFEALALWRGLITQFAPPRAQTADLPLDEFEQSFGKGLFSIEGPNTFSIEVDLDVEQKDVPRTPALPGPDADVDYEEIDAAQVSGRIRVGLQAGRVFIEAKILQSNGAAFHQRTHNLVDLIPPIHVIPAERRFQAEARNREAFTGAIHHGNLKKALFYAYLSADLQQKKRFAAIKTVLAEPPFSLGELDVALDQGTDQIDIGFIRPQGRLPLDNLGAGSRQLLLVLGQVFLSDFPIVALEEPEMNLSPQWQQDLMIALRRLMQDPAIGLKQIFISTHSPYFEFSENFYDVTLDESGHAQVKRTTSQDWSAHFAVAPLGPETGARVNSLNQVQLYDRLIEDLDLRRGDMVVFVRNETGRWELRKAEEIAKELRPVTTTNGKS